MSVEFGKQAILMSLRPMFEKAEAKGLWFFHESSEVGELWCSPEYLHLKQSQGELIWAPEHWELRSPLGYMKSLRAQVDQIVKEFNDLSKRFGHDKSLELSEVAGADPAAEE